MIITKVIKLFSCSEHEILDAHKNKMLKIKNFRALEHILLINVKMPTIVGILTFMSWISFVVS